MDNFSLIIIVIGIISNLNLYHFKVNASLKWKTLISEIFLFSITITFLHILLFKSNLQNNLNLFSIYVAISLALIVTGLFFFIKKNNKIPEKSGQTNIRSFVSPAAVFLLFVVTLSTLFLNDNNLSVYLIILIIDLILIIINIIFHIAKLLRKNLFNQEHLSLVSFFSGLYIIIYLILPGDYMQDAKLFTNQNLEVDLQNIILLVIMLVVAFLIGFYFYPKNKDNT